MKFHSVHGTSVTLTENKGAATRADTNFCNGIVFGDQPVSVCQKVCIELACSLQWSGALRVGFTTNDPARLNVQDLPKYSLPHLSQKEGYWIRPMNENVAADGVKLTFYVNNQGHVQFFLNNEHKGALLVGLPTDKSLWILFDIYGNTKAIRFVKPDDAPKEIRARGHDAVQAYETACKTGVVPVYRTRLMLLGREGAGKTSLKKALIGQRSKEEQESTHGIDTTVSCTFKTGQQEKWSSLVSSEEDDKISGQDTEGQQGVLGGEEAIQEEYYQALATNIVQELIYQKRQKTANVNKPRTPAVNKDHAKGHRKSLTKPLSASNIVHTKLSDISPQMFSEVPPRVVEIVQQMLDQRPIDTKSLDAKSQESISMTTKPPDGTTFTLNVWDFAGRLEDYTTHQLFLSRRAVYLIVLDLRQDLHASTQHPDSETDSSDELSPLDYMDFWMRSVYAHTSQNTKSSIDNMTLSPPILVIGTHSDSLHSDPHIQEKLVEEKFSQIRDFVSGKPYVQHLVTPFFSVDTSKGEDRRLEDLRCKIAEVSGQEVYMGEQIPVHWMRFEQEVNRLVAAGTYYASVNQMKEMAANLEITDRSEVTTMLEFYHDLGVLIFYGSGKVLVDNLLAETVILKPNWLIDMFGYVMSPLEDKNDKWNLMKDKWTRLKEFGILEEPLLDILWGGHLAQKPILIGLMEKFNLIYQRLPLPSQMGDKNNALAYYIPSLFAKQLEKEVYYTEQNTVKFYIDFNGFLPDGLFHQIITRTIRWTQECSGQNPQAMSRHKAKFYLTSEHDFYLEKKPRLNHSIKVCVVRVQEEGEIDKEEQTDLPSPEICAKVRNFLESCLTDVRERWMQRISYTFCVACPCSRTCGRHGNPGCQVEVCLHFLNLDECLSNKIVCCEHRRVKTKDIKITFPEPLTLGFTGPVLPMVSMEEMLGNIEKHYPTLPRWLKSVAKLLNVGDKGKDWQILAQELGYKQNKLNEFNDDLNPSLALLADWIISSGNTALSVDMLTVYLDKMERDDVLEIIRKAQETEQEPAQIFITYQWDIQDEVKVIRDKLERSGFTCWMDIGQMGGGDQLYTKIDEGIRNSKVVLACISPKYVVSQHCVREMSLADLLCKPIVPVVLEPVPWPPPGAMSLILSQLVYINMKGVGGHGGSGIHADRNDKFNEIIQRVSQYAIPDLSRCTDTEVENDERKSDALDLDALTDTDYSDNDPMNMLSHQSSFTFAQVGSDLEPTVARPLPMVEQVHVARCRVCVIL